MQAHAVSNAAVKSEFASLALSYGPGHQASSHLAAISSLQRKAPGETLFTEGDETNSVYEIVRGMLRLVKLLPDGRRQITGFLSSGHLLGLAPEGVNVYTAEAVTEVTLCRYGRAAFERLIDEVPGFAKRLLTVTSHELRVAQDQMLLLGRKTAMEKVASFLLLIAKQQDGDATLEVDLPMTRSDIADYLGLTIETVSRTLTKLKQDGRIALPATTRITICDRDRLEELAAGDLDTGF
ncbi:MAG TPA: helix-turn-helix domain-containing protein [Methylocella sp.]|nr:helix-turn-helix domain-containing protein [Methylocella sp.]